ncbi:MAG: riboflavin biosynthesis protein RibF [Dehalococcoidia bacterium]|nr:riboflavin biosynthesis protein RibF [Dehalococcoidia bacterium]MDP7613101.1 riboflavin biosynthesis protein RibF [Dehalococcoidia bacterium]
MHPNIPLDKQLKEQGVFIEKSVISIGTFDGVHLGHQALLNTLSAVAKKNNAPSIAIVFKNAPRSIINKDNNVNYLCPLEERVRLLKSYVDHVILIEFNRSIRNLSSTEFLNTLRNHIGATSLVAGENARIGYDQKQIKELVTDHETNCAIEIIPIQIKLYKSTRYSSSNIRSAITKGQFLETKDLLGRYYKLEGQVVRGHERGRLLGFPTANIKPEKKLLIPGTGIFACVAQIDDNSHPATTSIGYNPTFEPAGKLTVESHISDFDGDLYGRKIGLIFVQKLRDEIKFHSEEELIEQMKLDICQSKKIVVSIY